MFTTEGSTEQPPGRQARSTTPVRGQPPCWRCDEGTKVLAILNFSKLFLNETAKYLQTAHYLKLNLIHIFHNFQQNDYNFASF